MTSEGGITNATKINTMSIDRMNPLPIIEPSLLEGLTETERRGALEAAESARRAEERVADRIAMKEAIRCRKEEREKERLMEKDSQQVGAREIENNGKSAVKTLNGGEIDEGSGVGVGAGGSGSGSGAGGAVKFVSRKNRGRVNDKIVTNSDKESIKNRTSDGRNDNKNDGRIKGNNNEKSKNHRGNSNHNQSMNQNQNKNNSNESNKHHLTHAELGLIKRSYLGESALLDEATERRKEVAARRKRRREKKITFKFEWDGGDNTMEVRGGDIASSFGHVPIGGGSNQIAGRRLGGAQREREKEREREQERERERRRRGTSNNGSNNGRNGNQQSHYQGRGSRSKELSEMTSRDWRIFREDHDIVVRGGRAPPPLRYFRESNPPIHRYLIDAIENVLRYKDPSPIQRQAIPVGLQRRDLIGIAETGSGKTSAFGVPLCHHVLSLPSIVSTISNVAENGPLALVMAPTRELALQIDIEFKRLLSRCRPEGSVRTLAVVGGQPIQVQASALRDGVHIVVGTPGRINDCVESTYLVLNQCSYVVLDEADRMIDLGFAPQIDAVLDAMGGLLKSEDEKIVYQQEKEDLKTVASDANSSGKSKDTDLEDDDDVMIIEQHPTAEAIADAVPKHRLTAMFSATMPTEVERIARRYLRHPAIVSIGDRDSSKNRRIEQRIMYLPSVAAKERTLTDLLRNTVRHDEKAIVFVNEKRHTDAVGRIVERAGRRHVVLHGGKTQEHREENLEIFRRSGENGRGGGCILVATDVAGRGIDVPDVSHIINYDLPTRNIDVYCHRIGRTGRAGKTGIATSFVTDADEGIMAQLRSYLESTGAVVPEKLKRHPASIAGGAHGGNIQ